MKHNLLFKGDNLDVLTALKATHRSAFKCVYLDPPYNTGINRQHFLDNRESSEWVSMMKERLVILKSLISEDGSIWISIDDTELCSLKKLCDEIFGKENFLAIITWQHKINWEGYRGKFQLDHTYIICYRKTSAFNFENNAKPRTVWLESEVGGRVDAIEESRHLFGEKNIFSTPKPERLLKYIIELTTKKNELVLDCFSGSGTTGSVAQKIERYWVMIEMGDQCETHILPRMNQLATQLDPKEINFGKKPSPFFLYFPKLQDYMSFIQNNPAMNQALIAK